MSRTLTTALMAGVFAALSLPAIAANIDSVYTQIDLDECQVLEADDFGVSWACPGYKGYPLYVAEGDLRFFVSYGFGAPEETAAHQTIPEFNYINETLEWRLSNASGDWRPFATILRWFGDPGDETMRKRQVLVVTKIEPGNTCHIAYIDAELTTNANVVAREWADNTAADFQCDVDQPVHLPN